jgi:hypothetical protein
MFVAGALFWGIHGKKSATRAASHKLSHHLRAVLSPDEDDFANAPPAIRALLTKQTQSARTLFGRAQHGAEAHKNLWWLDGKDYTNPEGIMEMVQDSSEGNATTDEASPWLKILDEIWFAENQQDNHSETSAEPQKE